MADGRRGSDASARRSGDGAEPRTARSFWSGTITFGLVSIPVDFLAANRPRRVSMRMLAPDGQPLSRRYVCPEDDRVLSPDELARGYEIERGRMVTVTDEELEALEPSKTRDIALQRFVPREEISPLLAERGYFLAPSGSSDKAYHLLAETMEASGQAGVATFVMRGREHLVAITAEGGLLRGEILRFEDEVRSPEDVGLPEPPPVDPARVERIADAIREREAPFDRGELRDRQAEALRSLASDKRAQGRDVVEAPEAGEEEPGEVVDLMQVLKERLGTAPAPARPNGGERAPTPDGGERAPTPDGGERSDRDEHDLTKTELYERARALDIPGRSRMTRDELAQAIRSTR